MLTNKALARPLFNSYLMVDWSAASEPKTGKDSIWIGLTEAGKLVGLENPSTRAEATDCVIELTRERIRSGRRVLLGFDFPLGFPAATAEKLDLSGPPWLLIWEMLARQLKDKDNNSNNRFDVAESLNKRISGEAFPFWGNVREERRPFLKRRGRRKPRNDDLCEYRFCECSTGGWPRRQPQSVWKLVGAGSVGSQALTGIPRVWNIRQIFSDDCRVWPFETGLRHDPKPRALIAEIYPSIVSPCEIEPKDAGQVAAIGKHFAELDSKGKLESLFGAGGRFEGKQRKEIEREEGWILGVSKDGQNTEY